MTDDAQTPFHDLDAYAALPRISGLSLSADGTRLVTSVATLDAKKQRYVTALWEVDPAGHRPARRLTRSAKGEQSAAFLPDGDLLFTSARPDPAASASDDDDPVAALWLLPAGGGEARVVASRPGGVGGPVVAREAGTVVLGSATLPGATDASSDGERRKARKEKKVSAILHEGYPVRFWDHDLGPDQTRLLAGTLDGADAEPAIELRDLTPAPGRALDEASYDVSPDGRTVVTTWSVAEPAGSSRYTIVAIDVASGERRTLADDFEAEFFGVRISPDGSTVAVLSESRSTPHQAPSVRLAVVPLAGGDQRAVASDWDGWPTSVQWTPDGAALVVTVDENGRGPLFRVDVASGERTRLTGDDGTYSDVQVSTDGRFVYALRATVGAPPAPVRLAAEGKEQGPSALRAPAEAPLLPGTLTEVTTASRDGVPLRAWLVLPSDASPERPAPLLLWIHGGPLSSWNAWSWRWNPWLMAARGYAVLLPDPALSTGYGQQFIQRGWGSWGAAPYTDLMDLTDAALQRGDLDSERTAAMGGSFGGYMANWVAGHTDRFRAIVTHASLWALDQFGPTTDAAHYWLREMTPQMSADNSPHAHADAITTPMLVIHGDRDYRVPIGEALRLWWDLLSRGKGEDGTTPHKFLYFPDENHWVLTPNHAVVWYQTVLAFLAQHVLGEQWQSPDLLR